MQTLIKPLLFILGFTLGAIIFNKCSKVEYKNINTVEYRFKDTLVLTHVVEVPTPVVKWKSSKVKLDTIYEHLLDSAYVYYPVQSDTLPINSYEDSLITSKIKLKWKIGTVGYLSSFEPTIEYIQDSIVKDTKLIFEVKPKNKLEYLVSVSNKLGVKAGIGYKGWFLEPAINFDINKYSNQLFQIYLTKKF